MFVYFHSRYPEEDQSSDAMQVIPSTRSVPAAAKERLVVADNGCRTPARQLLKIVRNAMPSFTSQTCNCPTLMALAVMARGTWEEMEVLGVGEVVKEAVEMVTMMTNTC